MKSLLALLALLALLVLPGCSATNPTPDTVSAGVETAGIARTNLVEALDVDRALFSDQEWSDLNSANRGAVGVNVAIQEGLAGGIYPDPAQVQDWIDEGVAYNDGAKRVLTAKRLEKVSIETFTLWSTYQSKLRALHRAAVDYIADPSASRKEAMARAGLAAARAIVLFRLGVEGTQGMMLPGEGEGSENYEGLALLWPPLLFLAGGVLVGWFVTTT